MKPRCELLRLLLPRVVEVEAEVGVEAEAEVVVHHEYLRVVLVSLGRADSLRGVLGYGPAAHHV